MELFQVYSPYCPFCGYHVVPLNSATDTTHLGWVKAVVLHYRYVHSGWEAYIANKEKYTGGNVDYEAERMEFINRAVRQLVRKHAPFLLQHGITAQHLTAPGEMEPPTLALIEKKLTSPAKASASAGLPPADLPPMQPMTQAELF